MTPEAIPHEAYEAGTVNRPDRSRQYQAAIHKTPEKLVEGLNAVGAIARSAKSQADRWEHRMNVKLRHSIYVAGVTGLIARGPELFHWLRTFFFR